MDRYGLPWACSLVHFCKKEKLFHIHFSDVIWIGLSFHTTSGCFLISWEADLLKQARCLCECECPLPWYFPYHSFMERVETCWVHCSNSYTTSQSMQECRSDRTPTPTCRLIARGCPGAQAASRCPCLRHVRRWGSWSETSSIISPKQLAQLAKACKQRTPKSFQLFVPFSCQSLRANGDQPRSGVVTAVSLSAKQAASATDTVHNTRCEAHTHTHTNGAKHDNMIQYVCSR